MRVMQHGYEPMPRQQRQLLGGEEAFEQDDELRDARGAQRHRLIEARDRECIAFMLGARDVDDAVTIGIGLDHRHHATSGRRVMAVIKANAYGHGIVDVARALHESDAFAVACLDEAMTLRAAGIAQLIVLLEGFFSAEELPLLSRHRLIPVLHHAHQLDLLERAGMPGPLSVWIKIDSGMHRRGFPPERAAEIYRRVLRCANVSIAGFMTHLANADVRDDELTRRQIACFNAAVADLPGERSIANSAGVLAWPETQAD